jgi:hypothetical protein
MQLADGIRKHGFRKWYERELLHSHAHLLLLSLCAIGLLASAEAYDRRAPLAEQAADVFAVLLLAAVGLWSLRRYLYLLMHAEQIASQAVCAQCKTYGRFSLAAVQGAHEYVTVCCRKCRHEWRIAV